MNAGTQLLYVAWQDPDTRRILPVGRVVLESSGLYEFAYIHGATEARQHGFLPLVSFPDMERVYRSPDAFPLLQNRLLQPSRPDYGEYLNQLGLDPRSAEPFTVLARSGGRRTTDKLEVFSPPTAVGAGKLGCVVFARGIRHVAGAEHVIAALQKGTKLQVVADPGNRYNPKALKLQHGNDALGYLPDYLASELTCQPDTIEAVVGRVNAPPASVQHRLLLEVAFPTTTPPPFTGGRYKPLPATASQIAA
jgi:hypothetical protein